MAPAFACGRICFIGCGKMGEAMLAGWMASEDDRIRAFASRGFDVVVPRAERAAELAERYGVRTFSDASEAPSDASIVIVAVKPQMIGEVLPLMKRSAAFAATPPLLISIAAGVPSSRFEGALGKEVHVICVMPNMPLQVRAGATVVAKGASATDAEAAFVNDLFAALGASFIVDEAQIDAACALSGGGPAYLAYLAECMADAGVRAGLEPPLAEALARQTLAGTGACVAQTPVSLADLRASVCSPGGTTLAALAAMQEGGFQEAVFEGIASAVQRAKELSTC